MGEVQGQFALGLLSGTKGQDVELSAHGQGGDVVGAEHAAIGHQHGISQSEAALQLLGHRLQGGDVHRRAREDAVGDGQPLLGDRQPDHDLGAVAAMIAGVAVLGQFAGSVALEVGRGEVVEHQLQRQAEEIGEADEEPVLELLTMRMETVHRAQVVVVIEGLVAVRPLHLALPAPVQVAMFVGRCVNSA
jgi:hypothetical protein